MSLKTMLTKPVTLIYSVPNGKDEYGQPVSRETRVQSVCYYRLQNTLIGDAVYQAEEQIKVYLDPKEETRNLSGVQIDSTKYEPAGVPHLQWNPRLGKNEYLMVSVRRSKS